MRGRAVLVLGVGNADRGDDGVGPAVALHVGGLGLPGVRVVVPAAPTDLLDESGDADLVVVVDAMRSGAAPGTVQVREVGAAAIDGAGAVATGAGGTHALGLDAAVELARALGRLPQRVVLVTVEGGGFERGSPLSAAVRAAVAVAVGHVVRVVDPDAGGEPTCA